MKEVTTRYYCDRCGGEIRAYGRVDEIEPGFGVVAIAKQYPEVHAAVFKNVADWTDDARDSRCSMALCKECMDGLAGFLGGGR